MDCRVLRRGVLNWQSSCKYFHIVFIRDSSASVTVSLTTRDSSQTGLAVFLINPCLKHTFSKYYRRKSAKENYPAEEGMQQGCVGYLYCGHILHLSFTKVRILLWYFPARLPEYIFQNKTISISYSRLLTSVYEVATFNSQENCKKENLEFLPLWFLYSIVTMNGLLVRS